MAEFVWPYIRLEGTVDLTTCLDSNFYDRYLQYWDSC